MNSLCTRPMKNVVELGYEDRVKAISAESGGRFNPSKGAMPQCLKDSPSR